MKKGFFLSISIELIPDPDEGGYTARVPDVPAYGEGATAEEAIQDLKEALKGYVEAFGIEELQKRMSTISEIRTEEWDVRELAHG